MEPKKISSKVAHVLFNLRTGGTELMLLDIVRCQLEMGADVSLILINREHESALLDKIDNRVKVYAINRSTGSKNPYWYLKYNYILSKIDPDIIHFHNDKAVGFTIKRKNVAYVGTVHDTRQNLIYYPKKLDKIYAISSIVKDDLSRNYNINAELIYNGIDTEQIDYEPKAGSYHDVFRIVMIGRLMHEKKGQDVLLKAVSLLPKEIKNNIAIDIIGEGPSEKFLQEMIGSLSLTGVRLLGNLDRKEIYARLKDYDLFIQPSVYEGFGLTVAEAMAAGVPVIVSGLEGPMEIIKDGGFGLYFKVNDEKDLASKIRYAFSHYDEIVKQYQETARRHILDEFDIKTTSKNYLESYIKTKREKGL